MSGYFTVFPVSYQVGFTDQLVQFTGLYKLGRLLGLRYLHSHFFSRRSEQVVDPGSRTENNGASTSEYADIYDFLGFNEHLHENGPAPAGALERIDIGLNDGLFRGEPISVPRLLALLRERIAAETRGSAGRVLVRFKNVGWKIRFLGLLQSTSPERPDGLELRALYFETRRRRPWPSLFEPGALRVAVHVRQGDTAVLPTPWGTFMPLWPRRVQFTEHTSTDEIPCERQIEIEDFARLVSALIARLPGRRVSVRFFSDGFGRAIRKLRHAADRLGLSDAKKTALETIDLGALERREFSPLFQVAGEDRVLIGEEDDKLFHLVHSCLTADVIVVGPRQEMVAKLLLAYCQRADMPWLIVLHRGADDGSPVRGDHEQLGIGLRGEKLRYLNLRHRDLGPACQALDDCLRPWAA